jgi:hypothetical protein
MNREYTNRLGLNHVYRGWALVRAGRPAEAAAALRRALALWEKGKPGQGDMLFEQSRVLALLTGLAADAKSDVTAAFADQAVAALRATLQAGWGNWAELKEPDFDSIRERPEFQKFVTEPEAKTAGSRPSGDEQTEPRK